MKLRRAKSLNLKECSDYTRLAFSPTRATVLNILGVIRRDDVLSSLGVVHNGVYVWEEAVKGPVKDASGDEGIYISDVEAAEANLLACL